MKFDEFMHFWDASIARRDARLNDPYLRPWFLGTAFPPIVGFGLPAEGKRIDVITVGLNPSDREITGSFLPAADDPSAQWIAQQAYFNKPYTGWFDRAESILCAASGGKFSYGGKYGDIDNGAHLDVSPPPTAGKFDKVFCNKGRSRQEQSSARQMLVDDSTDLLFPLVELLQEKHSLSTAIVFGFAPPNGGSGSMKKLWRGKASWESIEFGSIGSITIARASPTAALSPGTPGIRKIQWLFMSQGPSSRAEKVQLQSAAGLMRQRGWLPRG